MQTHAFHTNNLKYLPKDKCILSCIGDTVSAKTADIVSATDYSPFGAPLAGRTWQAREYRFGFNGKEKDNETYGYGNEYDYGLRIYDPRVARFLSVDPLEKEYPWNSTFSYAEDNPIKFVDLDGAERAYKKPDGTFVTPGDHFYSPMPKVAQKQFLVHSHPDMTIEGIMTTAVVTGPLILAIGTEQILWHTYAIAMRMSPMLTSSALVASRYGSDVANFIYGFATDDQKEPFPGNYQSSDAGAAAKKLFSGVGGQLLDRTLNSIKKYSAKMNVERIDDAMKNINGEFITITNPAIKKGVGSIIDHLQSLENNLNGLNRQIRVLKQGIKDKVFNDEQTKFANDLIQKIGEKVTLIKDQMAAVKVEN